MTDLSRISALIDEIEDTGTISRVNRMLRRRHRELQTRAADQFKVGDAVAFTDRNGAEQTGTITKINYRTVRVQVMGASWKVSAGLLHPVVSLSEALGEVDV